MHHTESLIPRTIYTLKDAWTAWLQGSKFPIAFFGDSTVDGANTTDWTENTLGRDSTSPNTFSKKLEELLRLATNNASLRIYNAGFSGQSAKWAVSILEEEFGGTAAYDDVKMIGIGFGINDRLGYANEQAYRDGFKELIKHIIHWCYNRGIQPFLLTTQACIQPGVMTQYAEMYPMRTGGHVDSIANEVKRDLAREYGLQLIDMNRFTESFLLYSSVSARRIISDQIHFGDTGHQYEAAVLFSHICPRTIIADGYTKIDYTSQKVTDSVPEDWLTLPEELTDRFKVFIDHTKPDTADLKIMSAWVFVNARKMLTLKAYRNHSSDTYVLVNGTAAKQLAEAETVIAQLDMGLYRLEVYTGASHRVDFKGFILE